MMATIWVVTLTLWVMAAVVATVIVLCELRFSRSRRWAVSKEEEQLLRWLRGVLVRKDKGMGVCR